MDNKVEIKIKIEDDEICVYFVVLKNVDVEGAGLDIGVN